jgi:hypothetical protein
VICWAIHAQNETSLIQPCHIVLSFFVPFYSKERATPKVISLLVSSGRPPLLQRPSGQRCEEGSPAPRRMDLYSCSFLLLACSSPCLGLGLLLLISGGGGGLGTFSGGSHEPFGPPPRCGVHREREVDMAFFICVRKGSFPLPRVLLVPLWLLLLGCFP